MTLSSTTTKTQFNGDDGTVAFATGFYFQANSQVKVILTVTATGVETDQVLDTDFTLSGAGVAAGGTVTMTSAPATGERLTVKRAAAETQATDYPQGGAFPANSTENALDKLTMLAQAHSEEIARAVKLAETSTTSELTFPEPDNGKVIGWLSGALDNITSIADNAVSSFMATVLDDTTAAAARTTLGLGTFAIENTAAVPAQTLAGAITGADQVVTAITLKDYGETEAAQGDLGGGTDDLDLTTGNVFSATVSTSEETFTFSNPTASGDACSFTLILTNGGSQTVNWPASVDWAGGNAPSLTAAGVDILTFVTIDGGTIWYGFSAGLDMQ